MVELSVVGRSIAAAIAIFRFEVGMIPTLAACCIAGVVLYLVGDLVGAIS
jgi:chromate transporter